ncbi:Svx/AvrXca family virulence/avirulence protein [Sphingomonas sp. DG1-23]|uniref:Svx/AvrXca family virulence/avirulence protein n=1 Tax=Sphingomonas sp. DG1-23 TaxID=3068316 RepID=UPI00273D57E5|nr:Svx/AvrXca family virulence/avirulence protein [Sphingomonas sp. DG1-23]MDP5278996.1 Svx/AvrXca family virulence/avirulence protein [Sphingomonas sp. DG1-23]
MRLRVTAAALGLALVSGGGSASAACVAGAWSPVATDPADPNAKLPLRYETPHFAFHWTGDLVSTQVAKAAGEHLEAVWSYFIGTLDFPEPDCVTATKRKTNVFIDASYGLTGGVDDAGNIGMWIGPGGLKDRFGLAHELTHSLQGGTGSFRDTPFGGWLWESHANWMTTQLPEFRGNTHCSVLSVNYPHLYYGSSRVRYCNWQFLEYLKNRFGYAVVNDIWRKAPGQGSAGADRADPIEVLMRNQGWTLTQLNDAFGDWAMHNAHWDYTNPDGSDQGAIYRREYGGYEPQTGDRLLRTTLLDPLDLAKRRFAVPAAWAPQRWGYNLVRLAPDTGATRVTATFRGVVQRASATTKLPGLADEPAAIPAPAPDWRWGLIAVDVAGKSRYSPLQRGADAETTLALRPDDQGLYLIVVATPAQFQHIRWEQPWHSIYRYPWMVQFAGATPVALAPIAGGHRHKNGGGWVAAGAKVDASAYVGPYARVLSGSVRDQAQVEDHAVIDGGELFGRARVSALSVIRGNTIVKDDARVATTFLGIGEYEKNIVLSGTAQLIGDVEQRGASFARGAYSGFVDQAAASDPKRGADLTGAPAEVTAKPNYVWRK